jgi:hypothetical protein
LPLADSAKAIRTRIEPRRAIRLTGESLASRALLVNTSSAESTCRHASDHATSVKPGVEVSVSPKPMLVCSGQSALKSGIFV